MTNREAVVGRDMRSRRLIDPQLRSFADAWEPGLLDISTLAQWRARPASYDPPIEPGVALHEIVIPGAPGDPEIPVVVLAPDGLAADAPSLLYIHGGGFVAGSPRETIGWCSELAKAAGCVAFLPSYRLAPETRWQGAIADLYAALEWVHENAGRFGATGKRLSVGGASAGGGHAAALALHARRMGGPRIDFQLLLCPMLDDRQAKDPFAGEYVWTRHYDRFGWQSLLGMEPGGPDVPMDAVPARATDLAGLPATFIEVGALELFAEASIDYAKRLMADGVAVEFHLMPGAYHGYEFLVPQADISQFARSAAIRALKNAFR